MPELEISALAEGVEAEFMYQYESGAPPHARSLLGIATTRIGGGVALAMRHDSTGYWNKALGFGFANPITGDLIEEILDFYRTQGSRRAVLQFAPSVLPPDWPDICAAQSLNAGSRWVKLACRIEDFRPDPLRLRAEAVDAGSAQQWAEVILRGFGMPAAGLADMLAASVEHPAFRPYLVRDRGDIVAGGNLFIHQGAGALNASATLPEYRNRGAQSALLAARASEAAAAGCSWLVAETGLPASGSTNPSLNNLLRAGLRTCYTRQNWIWQDTQTELD